MKSLSFDKVIKDTRVRYLATGGSSVLLEYLSFWLLIALTVGVLTANVVSFLVGFLYTFFLHNKWSFAGNHTKSLRNQAASYGLLALINIVATTVIIGIIVSAGVHPLLAKLFCMALVAVWNYFILNRIIFSRS